MKTKELELKVSLIRDIDIKIESFGLKKKEIDKNLLELKNHKELLRDEIEKSMKDSGSFVSNLSDGTEISIRNGIKSFEWDSDDKMIDFLKSLSKFEETCSVETIINKKKVKSLLGDLIDCDGIPDFVIIKQDKILQIRSTPSQFGYTKEENNSLQRIDYGGIDEFNQDHSDGI